MKKLHVIRASAGSGKTHYLTGFFLKLLLREKPDYFDQMLAVTFTNKATAEMKMRILDELNKLALNQPSDYMNLVMKFSRLDEKQIRMKASEIQQNILHNFSGFCIETIDAFFQRVIRGFTHEMGIPGNYTIEIEHETALQFAIDAFLDNLDDKSEELEWLVEFSGEKIKNGDNWLIYKDLVELGQEIFKEKYKEFSLELTENLTDRKKLRLYRDQLFHTRFSFESTIEKLAKEALFIIESNGLSYDDFFQKSNGPKKLFENLSALRFSSSDVPYPLTSIFRKLLESPQNWPSSSCAYKEKIIQIASEHLLPILIRIDEVFTAQFRNYTTAIEILKHIYAIGILNGVSEKIREYRHTKNVFLLSDSAFLINRIINRNDTPFIYEKMGNRYEHFLIDEFQDTSSLQWNNFKPLIANSLSQNKENLLVGDAKQSIYRWRNSNWEILASVINQEFPGDIHFENLKTNWRSYEQIVLFNNSFFPLAVEQIKNQINKLLTSYPLLPKCIELLDAVYNDIQQEIPSKSLDKGEVFIRFFRKNEVKENDKYYENELIEQINKMLSSGYSLNEIAILVRNNKDGQIIANQLIQLNSEKRFISDVQIISDESLFLYVSPAVNLIIAALNYLNNPNDQLITAKFISSFRMNNLREADANLDLDPDSLSGEQIKNLLPEEFNTHMDSFLALPLYDLTEKLIGIFRVLEIEAEVPYIHALLDILHDFNAKNPADLGKFLDFWEQKGRMKTIPAGDVQNAIRILTIHKAKGLEFRGVIIPFCNWDFNHSRNPVIWVETSQTIFNYLPVVPVNYTKRLKETQFFDMYSEELFKSFVDNLNLLYVALTRAVESLVVFPVYNDSEKAELSTVGDLLFKTISCPNHTAFSAYDPISCTYNILSPKVSEVINSDNREIYFSLESDRPLKERVVFNPKGFKYFENYKLPVLPGNVRGSVMHEVLSNIVTHNDLESSVQEAIINGLITNNEANELQNHVLNCFKLADVFAWFNGTGKVITERDIILPGSLIKRPDRIVVYDEVVHVIDYKFGNQEQMESHIRQVKEYIGIINLMGFACVKGFLWYIDRNEVWEVN